MAGRAGWRAAALLFAAMLGPSWAGAEEAPQVALIAVAANFRETAEELKPLFEAAHPNYRVAFTFGSTGRLYAQLANGAPYHAFLAADQTRPALAVDEGHAAPGTAFTYAVGTLALYAADPERAVGPEALRSDFQTLVVANPATAPYGLAARQVLQALELWEAVSPKLAHARDVGGAFAAVSAGAAEMGFVSLASIKSRRRFVGGVYWTPPQAMYAPLRQDAVLLKLGRDRPAAAAFLAFLRSETSRELIASYGYRAP